MGLGNALSGSAVNAKRVQGQSANLTRHTPSNKTMIDARELFMPLIAPHNF